MLRAPQSSSSLASGKRVAMALPRSARTSACVARARSSGRTTTLAAVDKSKVNKVVLAYSGGLDTSVILKWLQDEYDCEVVTFTADLGQGEELEPARKKAEAAGVKEIFIDDLREEFVRYVVACQRVCLRAKGSPRGIIASKRKRHMFHAAGVFGFVWRGTNQLTRMDMLEKSP